jgi:hypothetical protein
MVGSSSNIYISATPGYEAKEGRDDQGYRRQQHTWLISIEPHRHAIPFIPRHKQEPTHFVAKHDETAKAYKIEEYPTQGIIGTILIAEGSHGSAEDIRKALEEGLHSTDAKLPSEQTAEHDTDRWIRKGVHVLQEQKLMKACDAGELMTFAHAYVANRLDREAPSMIAYPGLNKDHEKKARKQGFWLSYPTQNPKSAGGGGGHEESRRYGEYREFTNG